MPHSFRKVTGSALRNRGQESAPGHMFNNAVCIALSPIQNPDPLPHFGPSKTSYLEIHFPIRDGQVRASCSSIIAKAALKR